MFWRYAFVVDLDWERQWQETSTALFQPWLCELGRRRDSHQVARSQGNRLDSGILELFLGEALTRHWLEGPTCSACSNLPAPGFPGF